MTLRGICASGEIEAVKGAVHAVLGTLAAVCLVYNATAYLLRREKAPHLLWNAVGYAALTALEIKQVHRHWTKPVRD